MSAAKNPTVPKKKKELKFSKDEEEVEVIQEEIKEKPIIPLTGELTIKRMTLHKQILHRPDTYIGSTRRIESSDRMWVFQNKKFICKKIIFSEGLLRIFIEIMSNTIDNIWRSKQFNVLCKNIKVEIDRDTGKFSVLNDGNPISLDKFVDTETKKETGEYKPEVIFGELLTSTNYDDSEKRKTSGKNGVGSSLCNIFSSLFEIELFNPKFGMYRQKWTNNMFDKSPPVISTKKSEYPSSFGKTGYTKVSWIPDYKRFGMTKLDDEFMSVVEKSIYDYALIAGMHNVKVSYNDEIVPVHDLKSYALMYYDNEPTEMITIKTEECTVLLGPRADAQTKSKLLHISFINGILTPDGGVHIDKWEEALFRPIVNKVNGVKAEPEGAVKKPPAKKKAPAKKKDSFKVNIDHVRQHFTLFVIGEADNPEFKGQNKTYFSGPFSEPTFNKTVVNRISKWSFMEKLHDTVKLSELSKLKDEGKKKRNYVKIEGLDDANSAGESAAANCILCLTEGLSAKTYVVSAISRNLGIAGVIGRDNIGCLPLRGKILNTRKASNSSILNNKEVVNIIKALGLEYGLDYTIEANRKKLRYGKLYVVADGDVDGFHITGLVLNLFDSLFPTLLQKGDFFHFLRIPIIKINMKNERMTFLFQRQAEKWIEENNPPNKSIKYYKGLGTATKQDVKEDFGKYPVSLIRDELGVERMKQIFDKSTEFRKKWLAEYTPAEMSRTAEDYEVEDVNISSFLDQEMIEYSLDDCQRSLPKLADGQSESRRKILFACFKKKLKYSRKSTIKVGQLSGTVAEITGYHHGEQILYEAITKMAQRFPGANNIPLLYNDGQFGTRLEWGDDAAKARYIFTKFDMLTQYIFRAEDEPYLKYIINEAKSVEPEQYHPIVPMILINGAKGIGTAWSCTVPMYSLSSIIEWIKVWIENDGNVVEKTESCEIWETPELQPEWRGFDGRIEVDGTRITTYGLFSPLTASKYQITEIPIGNSHWSISKYREDVLETLKEQKMIKRIENKSSEDKPHFIITVDEEFIPDINNLKLKDTINTSNMVMYDKHNRLRKYNSVEDIMLEWCKDRYDLYIVRKAGQLSNLQEKLKWVSNKIKYITMVNSKKLIIENKDEDVLVEELSSLGFDKKPKKSKAVKKDDDEDKEEDDEDKEEEDNDKKFTFDYLLDMKHRSINIKSKAYQLLTKERDSLNEQIISLEKTTEKQIWLRELDELVDNYSKWIAVEKKRDGDGQSKKKKTKASKTSKDETD